jgi:hypothetical protein
MERPLVGILPEGSSGKGGQALGLGDLTALERHWALAKTNSASSVGSDRQVGLIAASATMAILPPTAAVFSWGQSPQGVLRNAPALCQRASIQGGPMFAEECPFKVVRTNGGDEVLAQAANLLIGRAAFETARRLYPRDLIEYRQGAQVIDRSEPQ